ncbi:MAG: hypothetical protein R6U78_02445, partial [Bacteroidales bacterium]
DITEYLNERREEVSTRTLADEIQIIKQFFKDLGVHWIDRIKKPKVRPVGSPLNHQGVAGIILLAHQSLVFIPEYPF